MRRAAKGLCFISDYKAVSEIVQYIDYVCLIGMRDLLTLVKVVFVCVFSPFTSARSSLVLSLSIFSFQSFESSFSMQDSEQEKRKKRIED